MPPIDSETPAVNLTEEDFREWRARKSWENDLDLQYEHRMQREGLFWHDPALDGLTDDERMWAIIQMGFRHVAKVLDSIGLVHYWEYFLQRGLTHPGKLRLLTRKYLETKMPKITDLAEREAILDACANCMRDEDMRFFVARYGDPDRHLLDCPKGRRFLSEKLTHEKWLVDEYDLTGPMHEENHTFEVKWTVPAADHAAFDDYKDFVAAAGADGMMFVWPVAIGQTRVPPCIRCKLLHSMVCTDFHADWERMMTASCGMDNKIVIYDIEKDAIIKTIRDGTDEQFFLCVDADLEVNKLAVGTNFGCVKVADIETGKMLMSLVGHQDHCRSVCVDWDLNQVVSCSWDSYVHVYDLRSAKLVKRLVGHNQTCNKVQVDFERQLAVSSSNESRFILWDLKQMEMIKRYDSPGHNVNSFDVYWDSLEVATGADDGLVKFWDLETGHCTSAIDCKHDMTLAMDADWQQGLLLTGSWDYNVDMWDIKTGDLLQHFVKPRRTMTTVKMSK